MTLTIPVTVTCSAGLDDALTYDERDVRAAVVQAIRNAVQQAEDMGFEHMLSSVLEVQVQRVGAADGRRPVATLEEAINRHVQQSVETVKNIPRRQRTILSKSEASVEDRANEMLQEVAKRLSKLGRDLVRDP